jgi:hypothetical protein
VVVVGEKPVRARKEATKRTRAMEGMILNVREKGR